MLPEGEDERTRRLRTNSLKEGREGRDSALFAYGIRDQVLRHPVWIAKSENQDYDFVMRWIQDESDFYCPVQLKELPPEDLNPQIALEDQKYSGVQDLLVAIRVNRRGSLH